MFKCLEISEFWRPAVGVLREHLHLGKCEIEHYAGNNFCHIFQFEPYQKEAVILNSTRFQAHRKNQEQE